MQWFPELPTGGNAIVCHTVVEACYSGVILFCLGLCRVGILTRTVNQIITLDHVSKTVVTERLQIS